MTRPRTVRAVPPRRSDRFDPRPAPRLPGELWFVLGALSGGGASFLGFLFSTGAL